jgi:transcription elongation factor Elf1
MNGAYVSGTTANAPQCTNCPTGMTNLAGSAGGYGDSADPNLADLVAKYAAASSVNSNLLTWCSVPADAYLTTAVTATSPGAITTCITTYSGITVADWGSLATTITGPTAVQTAAQCFTQSRCGSNEYLKTTAATTTTGAQLLCVACPTNMISAGNLALTAADVTRAKALVEGAAAGTDLAPFTYCGVAADSYLTTAVTTTSPGAATTCQTTYSAGAQNAAGGAAATAIIGATVVQSSARCLARSTCAANKYLDSDSATSTTGAQLTCKNCPTGMTADANPYLTGASIYRAFAAVSGSVKAPGIFTWCDVPAGSWLSTAANITSPGGISTCDSGTYQGSFESSITGPTIQTEALVCRHSTSGAVGATGATGATGAAGAAGAAANASPAAPLSTLTAAMFGAVVPAVLILV